jgi:hypothetical protein
LLSALWRLLVVVADVVREKRWVALTLIAAGGGGKFAAR